MFPFKDFFFRLTHTTPERKASRTNLRKARNGDAEAYLSLAANYLDMVLVYFGTLSQEPLPSRLARVERVFATLWRKIAYAERVSDFEFMLANALSVHAPEGAAVDFSDHLINRLRNLDASFRFALIAHDFENWPVRWTALVLRARPKALHRLLSEGRCALCGVSWDSLTKEEQECLMAISHSMAASPNLRANKELYEKVALYPRVSEIKAHWLELRPHLVEVRYRFLLEADEREQMLADLYKSLQVATRDQAPLVDRVFNSVHFTRHGEIKVS